MAVRSRHSMGWLVLVGVIAVVVAIALWLLFAGRAATPTAQADLELPRSSVPDAPRLPPVEPPSVPSPSPPPAPVG
jgi:hypothetical protein